MSPRKDKSRLLKVKLAYETCITKVHFWNVNTVLHEFVFTFRGISAKESGLSVYNEDREYDELQQDQEEKRYENSEVADKIYVSLNPVVMETIRDHMRSTSASVSPRLTIPCTSCVSMYNYFLESVIIRHNKPKDRHNSPFTDQLRNETKKHEIYTVCSNE